MWIRTKDLPTSVQVVFAYYSYVHKAWAHWCAVEMHSTKKNCWTKTANHHFWAMCCYFFFFFFSRKWRRSRCDDKRWAYVMTIQSIWIEQQKLREKKPLSQSVSHSIWNIQLNFEYFKIAVFSIHTVIVPHVYCNVTALFLLCNS